MFFNGITSKSIDPARVHTKLPKNAVTSIAIYYYLFKAIRKPTTKQMICVTVFTWYDGASVTLHRSSTISAKVARLSAAINGTPNFSEYFSAYCTNGAVNSSDAPVRVAPISESQETSNIIHYKAVIEEVRAMEQIIPRHAWIDCAPAKTNTMPKNMRPNPITIASV